MMVAQGAPDEELFQSVVEAVGTLLGVDAVGLGRIHDGDDPVAAGHLGRRGRAPARAGAGADRAGLRDLGARAHGRARAKGRLEQGREGDGPADARARACAPRSARRSRSRTRCGARSLVHSKTDVLLPPETEQRLERFAALIVTALTAAQSRGEVKRLADEQAALRRVATLVARQTPQAEVFAAVAEEIGRLLRVDSVEMIRYEGDRVAAVVADLGCAGAGGSDRDACAAGRPERHLARLPHGPRRTPRRLRGRHRADREGGDRSRHAVGRGHADSRRGPAVGRHDRRQHARRRPRRRTPSRASASSPS